MKIFLTGATGFIGSRLLRRLVERGDDVSILIRDGSETGLIDDLLSSACVRRVAGGLEDMHALQEGTREASVVIHTAGDVSYWRRDRERQERVNVGGTRNVLAASAESPHVERVLYTSSVAAVGVPEHGGSADEGHSWNAADLGVAYFTTKRAAEELVVAADLDTVIVNPAYVIGPGDVRFHDGNVFVDLHEGTIPLCPPGGSCWVDVDDVVEGHLLALSRGRRGERYILGGENLPYRHVFDAVASLLDVKTPGRDLNPLLSRLAAPVYELLGTLRNRYPRMTRETAFLFHEHLYFDSKKAIDELGYSFRPFLETARRTVAWYREHGYLPAHRQRQA